MDFKSTILTATEKTGQNSRNQVKYYSTKFEPPKKLERSKKLSNNIQKFLARKEEEERQKALDAREKRDKLLELRSQDKKATRRVNVMLKRTKSANQSAIQDAVGDHTSVTMAGSSQPDEDDYGYVSQSASDYYNKMMEKYNNMPHEPKWDFTKKKSNGSLSSTKDRVKQALNKEEEEAMQPHRRKRKHAETCEPVEPIAGDKYRKEEKVKPVIKAAPVINFNDLLKIAEKKQFEPIKVEPKKDKKEEERLLTKKQKREQEKEREYREDRERREKDRAAGRIPKVAVTTSEIKTVSSTSKLNSTKPTTAPSISSTSNSSSNGVRKDKSAPVPNSLKHNKPPQKCDSSNKPRPNTSNPVRKDVNGSMQQANSKEPIKKQVTPTGTGPAAAKPREIITPKPKEFPPRDIKGMKPKQFPPRDLKPKQFPPADMHRNGPPGKRKPLSVNKGRIYDDSDEEYDSEMDDFIDDGPEAEEDYSKHIRDLFGYDKRKYGHVDDDDENMESTFAQQMREEVISTKLGIMEDLEEQRKEDEHNRRKAMMKRRR